MSDITVSAIVAVSENGIIGRDGDMPWQLSTDLKRFKALTMGKPIIMGRKTFVSIGRPLPERPNLVISRSGFSAEGVSSLSSLKEAIAEAKDWCAQNNVDEICIIGGGQIYKEAFDLVDLLHVTHVLAAIEGDTSFPEISSADWELLASEDVPIGEKDSHATRFASYRRKH